MQSNSVTTGNVDRNACVDTTTAPLSLPPEISAEIFLQTQEQDTLWLTSSESPLLFGQVCRDWRTIAWSTPSLWSNVDVCLSQERYSVQAELLDEWLQRSKSVPLTIRIRAIKQDCNYWQLKSPTEVLRILASHSWHWKNVNLSVPHGWGGDLEPVRDNVPLLATLRVTYPTAEDQLQPFDMFRTAPSLHAVHLIYVYVPEITLPWHQITTFRGDDLGVEECLKVFLHCPQMKKCHFSPITCDDGLLLTPQEAFTHHSLEWLEIKKTDASMIHPLFDLITLPSLRRLGIGCRGLVEEIAMVSIVPLIRRSGCILENLSLNGAFFSEEEAIVCFQCIPSLVEVEIALSPLIEISAKFLSALSSPDEPLLPRLRILKLKGWISFDADELTEMLVCRWTRPEKLSCSVSRPSQSTHQPTVCVTSVPRDVMAGFWRWYGMAWSYQSYPALIERMRHPLEDGGTDLGGKYLVGIIIVAR